MSSSVGNKFWGQSESPNGFWGRFGPIIVLEPEVKSRRSLAVGTLRFSMDVESVKAAKRSGAPEGLGLDRFHVHATSRFLAEI